MSNKLMTCYDIDLNKLGFAGLPSNITYFKFEVGAEEDQKIAKITVRYYANSDSLSEVVEKVYGIVEI